MDGEKVHLRKLGKHFGIIAMIMMSVLSLTSCSIAEKTLSITILVYGVIFLICGLIFGFATRAIIYNKGYSDNWFWWGFFFGSVALIVAACKPECKSSYSYKSDSQSEEIRSGWTCSCGNINASFASTCTCGKRKPTTNKSHSNTDWKCVCGQWNPNYCGTCDCGMRKSAAAAEIKRRKEQQIEAIRQKQAAIANKTSQATSDNKNTDQTQITTETPQVISDNRNVEQTQITTEQEKIELLKEYKELLDKGVISEEEFNAKKASILKDD